MILNSYIKKVCHYKITTQRNIKQNKTADKLKKCKDFKFLCFFSTRNKGIDNLKNYMVLSSIKPNLHKK